MAKPSFTKRLLLIGLTQMVVIGSGLAFAGLTADSGRLPFENSVPALSMMLALVGLISFYGILTLPSEEGQANGVSDSRMRFALTAALVLTYLVYFSIAVWRSEAGKPLPDELLKTLTNLIMIILPFYFGVTGAVEIARARGSSTKSE